MSYPARKKTRYTYEDYLKMPEDKRYELIGGELIIKVEKSLSEGDELTSDTFPGLSINLKQLFK